MIVNYDPAKLEFVSFKAGAFGGLAEGGSIRKTAKPCPARFPLLYGQWNPSGEGNDRQITFKILNDSGSIPLKLEMRELVAYTPDGTETDLMDTVKTENASVSIKAPTTAPATTKPTTTAPDTTKPAATQPITEKPAESTTAETAVNPGTGEAHPLLHALHWPQQPAPRSSSPARKRARKRNAFAPLHTCPFSLRPAGGQAYPHLKAAWPQGRFALRSCRFRFSEACTCWNTVELIA